MLSAAVLTIASRALFQRMWYSVLPDIVAGVVVIGVIAAAVVVIFAVIWGILLLAGAG